MPEQSPSVGRIVHYVLPDGPSKGAHRPAIIVVVVPGDGTAPRGDGACDLRVFLHPYDGGDVHALHVRQAEGGEPGTWHWPEHVPAQD